MGTYVSVPGSWLGALAWRDVAARLRTSGHDVYPITLTGLGERVHLARPEVDLETHLPVQFAHIDATYLSMYRSVRHDGA